MPSTRPRVDQHERSTTIRSYTRCGQYVSSTASICGSIGWPRNSTSATHHRVVSTRYWKNSVLIGRHPSGVSCAYHPVHSEAQWPQGAVSLLRYLYIRIAMHRALAPLVDNLLMRDTCRSLTAPAIVCLCAIHTTSSEQAPSPLLRCRFGYGSADLSSWPLLRIGKAPSYSWMELGRAAVDEHRRPARSGGHSRFE